MSQESVDQDPSNHDVDPQEWRDFSTKFRTLRHKVLGKIFALEKDKLEEVHKRLREKEKQSYASVSNPRKYVTFHQSVGSTAQQLDAPYLDFPGEHSLLDFYEQLDKELDGQE